MKKLLRLLTFCVCLLSFSMFTYADDLPSTAYISYGIDGSDDWTWNQSMKKDANGNYYFTVNNITSNLRFFVHKETKGNWNDMVNANNVVYACGSGDDGNDYVYTSSWNDQRVYLYGTCKHCFKVTDKGNIKVSFYKNSSNELHIKYETVAAEQVNKTPKYQLSGHFNGYINGNDKEGMDNEGNGVYTKVVHFGEDGSKTDNAANNMNLGIRYFEDETVNSHDWYSCSTSEGKNYTASDMANGKDFTLSKNGNNNIIYPQLFGDVTFTLTVGSDGKPTNLNIKGGAKAAPVDNNKYYLWTNFRNNGTFKGYELNADNDFSYTLPFQGDESGTKAGIHINDSWRGANPTSEYNGTEKTYTMSATNGGDITFAQYLTGDVTFTYDKVAGTITVSGGAVVEPEETHTYKIKTDLLSGKYFELTADNDYTFKHTFTGNESGKYMGMEIDGNWKGASNASAYNGTAKTYNMTASDGGNITFEDKLTGEVTFVFNPSNNELSVSGGEIYVAPTVNAYISYCADGASSWTMNQPMTFENNENYFTVNNVQGNVKFYVHKNTADNIETLKSSSDNLYSCGNGNDTNDYVYNSGHNNQRVYLYGNCSHCFRVDDKGNIKVIFYTNSQDEMYIKYEVVGGGSVDPVDPEDGEYTVYFYDQDENAPLDREVYAYVWRGSTNNGTYPGKQMVCETSKTPAKYVYVGGKYLPVWSYTFDFSAENGPANVIFAYKDGNGNKKFVDKDLTFVNGGFYTNDGSYNTSLSLVEKKNDVITIYIHMDQDWVKEGDGTAPRCHVAWNNNTDGNNEFSTLNGDDEKMYLAEPKYQIWAYDIPRDKFNSKQYTNAKFYFPNKSVKYYHACNSDGYSADYWTEYIYAVNADLKAMMTYMTYDQFTEAAAKGYQNVYVVGGGDDGAKMKITVNGEDTDLSWTNPVKVDRYEADDACFYLELTPSFGSSNNARFKMTWVDVAGAAEAAKGAKTSARFWATFDLGIIGVDDILGQTFKKDGNKLLDIVDGNPGKSFMATNVSFPLLEYNQYDWVLRNDRTTANTKYWAIVDMHPTCRTVSLMTFDPNPSVNVSATSGHTGNLTPEQAKNMHTDHFRAAGYNGHILVDRVNYVKGSAEIVASNGLTVSEAGFYVDYSLYLNGAVAATYRGVPTTIHLDYMPMAMDANDGAKIRAMYTDKVTNLTAHSKKGAGKITNTVFGFAKPKACKPSVRYVAESYDENTGLTTYGIFVKDFNCYIDCGNTNAYADFEFFLDEEIDGYDVSQAVLMHRDHPIAKRYEDIDGWERTWAPAESEEDYVFYDETLVDNDWSTHLMKEGTAPVFIHNVAKVSDKNQLQSLKLKYQTYAVYPFMYDPDATYEFGTAAPRRVAPEGTIGTPTCVISNTFVPLYATTEMPELTVPTDNILSGIEEIGMEAEAADAAEVEYFTVSGVKVMGQPAAGIYLMRQGDKVSKVVIR